MKDLTRSYSDCVCELSPGFFLAETDDLGIHGSPAFWSAKVAPKSILLEKVKSIEADWKEEFAKNPGYPKIYTCTVSRTIHKYIDEKENDK